MQQISYESIYFKSNEYQNFFELIMEMNIDNEKLKEKYFYNLSKELEVTDIVCDKVKEDTIIPNNQTILSVLLSPSIKIKRYTPKKQEFSLQRILNDINGKPLEFDDKQSSICFFFIENQKNVVCEKNQTLDKIQYEHGYKPISFVTIIKNVSLIHCVFEVNGQLILTKIP